MNNHNTLFKNVMKFVCRSGIRFHDLRVMPIFIWAIVGAIQSQSPHLSKWLTYHGGQAVAASKARQFSRWLHNEKIRPMLIYQALVGAMLADWKGATLYLALDTTVLWKRFAIVRLALVYRGRAIPLGWVVVASGSATVSWRKYQQMLAQVAAVIPTECKVVILADRGFFDVAWMKMIKQLGWHFRLRIKLNSWVYRATKKRQKVSTLMPPPGQGCFFSHVWLTEQQYGPLHLALAHVITANGTEKWAIVSDEPVGRHTLDEYGLRFSIEENFLDDKSGGFNLEDSQLEDSMALSRLCLILAVATVYLSSTGTAICDLGLRHVVDTHWSRGLSYLQIGWRWSQYALSQAKWLLDFLWISPDPDPEIPISSWSQFYQPMFQLHHVQYL